LRIGGAFFHNQRPQTPKYGVFDKNRLTVRREAVIMTLFRINGAGCASFRLYAPRFFRRHAFPNEGFQA
jgi:hypothetical protein